MCLPAILVTGLDAPEKGLLEEASDGRYFGVSLTNKYGGIAVVRKLQTLGLTRQAGHHPKYGSARWVLTFCGCQAGKLLLDLQHNPLLQQPIIDLYNQSIMACAYTRKPPTRPNPDCCYRRNADEDFREIQRRQRLDDTVENRAKLLLARLRTGDITIDRVEAASEIGCPEAQLIVTPTGVVGWDWAIAVLAEHFPLRDFVAEAILHILQTFSGYDPRLAPERLAEVETLLDWPRPHNRREAEPLFRYVSQTFTNPKFDFSRYLTGLPTSGVDMRFMDRAQQHIRDLMYEHTPELLNLWGFAEVNRFMRAIRNTWLLPNHLVSDANQSFFVSNQAYIAINDLSFVRMTPVEAARELQVAEAEWQRQHIINWLLHGEHATEKFY